MSDPHDTLPPYDAANDPTYVVIPPGLKGRRVRDESLARWVTGCIAAVALAIALIIADVALVQSRNDANRRVKDLSAQIDCRGALTRREGKARDKVIESIGVIVGEAIISPVANAPTPEEAAARRGRLIEQGPVLQQWATEMNAALAELDRTDELCAPAPRPDKDVTTTTGLGR